MGESENGSVEKKCFVIMPISDSEDYEPEHFTRVYNYIIKPSCLRAGFIPTRADESQTTNYIVIDILKQIINADMVICDLSSRNPNVLYELGIRQAFNLPVTLIRDSRTPRIFDIQGLRDIEYDESLRIDNVDVAVEQIAETLSNTFATAGGTEVNSLIQLLGVVPAKITSQTELTSEGSVLLQAINSIAQRIDTIESIMDNSKNRPKPSFESNKEKILYSVGDKIYHDKFGEGEVIKTLQKGEQVLIKFSNDEQKLLVSRYSKMKKLTGA